MVGSGITEDPAVAQRKRAQVGYSTTVLKCPGRYASTRNRDTFDRDGRRCLRAVAGEQGQRRSVLEVEIGPNRHGVVEKTIPGGRCARIRHLGSLEYIGEADHAYREWLPGSGETLRDFPPFFHYVNVGPDVREEDMITDVYLPLV